MLLTNSNSAYLPELSKNRRGIALVSSILILFVLSFLASSAIIMTTTELKIGSNYKTSVQSFYNADAGVQYALGQIRNQKAAGTLNLTGSPVIVRYLPPAAFPLMFDGKLPFSNHTTARLYLKTGSADEYRLTTTGNYGNSKTSVQVVYKIYDITLVKGVFSSGTVTIKNNTDTFNAPEFGSNTSVDFKKDPTPLPTVVKAGGATYTGPAPTKTVPAIKPDPLDVAALVSENNCSSSNDNASASIVGNIINADKTLKTGDYYVTTLSNNTLTINNGVGPSGPVNIYVASTLSLNNVIIAPGSGPLNIYYHGSAKITLDSANINSGAGSIATNFSIFSDVDIPASPVLFDFNNSASFKGLLYAPYADVYFKNNADITGIVWSKTFYSHNNLAFTYDSGVGNDFLNRRKSKIVSWKQL